MRLGDPPSAQGRKAGHWRRDGGLAKRVTEKKAWLWRSSRAEWHLRYGLVPECVMGAGAQEKQFNTRPPG